MTGSPPQNVHHLAGRSGTIAVDLGHLLGQGATGRVFAASDKASTPLAVKFLVQERLGSPGSHAAFQREIAVYRRAARLGYFPVLDDGRDPQMGPWYATRRADCDLYALAPPRLEAPRPRGDLWALSRDGLESPLRHLLDGRLAAVVLAARRMVARVNDAGLVIRDLKAGNVVLLVERTDGSPPSRWGLTLVPIDPPTMVEIGSERGKHCCGTPKYMPYEVRLDVPISAADDGYAMAVLQREIMGWAVGIEPFPKADGSVFDLPGGQRLGLANSDKQADLGPFQRPCQLAAFVKAWRQVAGGQPLASLLEAILIRGSDDDPARRMSNADAIRLLEEARVDPEVQGIHLLPVPVAANRDTLLPEDRQPGSLRSLRTRSAGATAAALVLAAATVGTAGILAGLALWNRPGMQVTSRNGGVPGDAAVVLADAGRSDGSDLPLGPEEGRAVDFASPPVLAEVPRPDSLAVDSGVRSDEQPGSGIQGAERARTAGVGSHARQRPAARPAAPDGATGDACLGYDPALVPAPRAGFSDLGEFRPVGGFR